MTTWMIWNRGKSIIKLLLGNVACLTHVWNIHVLVSCLLRCQLFLLVLSVGNSNRSRLSSAYPGSLHSGVTL
jgi:hypothetical protein